MTAARDAAITPNTSERPGLLHVFAVKTNASTFGCLIDAGVVEASVALLLPDARLVSVRYSFCPSAKHNMYCVFSLEKVLFSASEYDRYQRFRSLCVHDVNE